MKTALVTAWLLSSSLACSSSGSTPDETSKFVGTWTYLPGSEIVATCAGGATQTIDLSKLPPQNQPGFFAFSSIGSASLHEVDGRGCQYDWNVSGDVATAAAGQSCATFPNGRGGNLLVHMTSGTKSFGDGSLLSVDVHFASDAPSSCAIHVQGT